MQLSCFILRLEVQADVASNVTMVKRASFSSESANFSIGEKSATVSFGDDASTKALAGSIAGYKYVICLSPLVRLKKTGIIFLSYLTDFIY